MPDLQDQPDQPSGAAPAPADLRGLRFLRLLVTLLTLTMIAGIVAMVALLYTRLPSGSTPAVPPALPDDLRLPEGATAQAVTAGPGWWAVVTGAGDILLYDESGTLLRRIPAQELAR